MTSKLIGAKFCHLIYSPKGEIEGALLECEGLNVQIVSDKHDEATANVLMSIKLGQSVTMRVRRVVPRDEEDCEHSVFLFDQLLTVDGVKPARPKTSQASGYSGTVVRLNYAKHGAANGVVLDSGDFIHTRPQGMKLLRLRVGDHVHADGDAHRLATDDGWAVEAVLVNGNAVAS